MKQAISTINLLQNQIDILPAIRAENKIKLDKKFRLEFNFNSNHIEGNTLTYGETELLLLFDKTEGNHEMREYEEMKAHDIAYKLIEEWANDFDFLLKEMHVKQLNEILLVRPFWKEAITPDGQSTRRLIKIGEYKLYPNYVRLQNGEIFYFQSPIDTPIQMGELMQWFKIEINNSEIHPIELAALLHYKFVCIHPFDDGNGRISRLLVNYVLLKNNLPPIIIKTADKKNYLFALNQADTGNLSAFTNYIAEQLIWSLTTTLKATKGESIDELGDLDKKLELIKLDKNIIDAELVKFSAGLFTWHINNQLGNFFDALENTLAKFDVFFIERKNVVIVNDNAITFKEGMSKAKSDLQKIIYLDWEKEIQSLTLLSEFIHIDNEKEKNTFLGCNVIFNFYPNKYSITTNVDNNPIYKLYNQEIVENVGNHILENIVSKL